MVDRHEIHELLENIRRELPGHTHGAYENAVNRAIHHQGRHNHHDHGHSRPIGWAMFERAMTPNQHHHQQEEEGALALFMLLVGMIGGAALMYLFDPERGAQRRAMLRGEVSKVAHEAETSLEHAEQRVRTEAGEVSGHVRDDVKKAASEVEDAAKHLGRSAAGAGKAVESEVKSVASETKKRAEGGTVAAQNLIARVQAEVKTLVSNPGAIEVTVDNGAVTLSGKIQSREVQSLVERIQALPGVRTVENHLEIHDATEK